MHLPTGQYRLGIGKIVGAFQGTNCYDVTVDGAAGRFRATWHDGFTGYPGVRNGGGLQAGAFVLVGSNGTAGDEDAFIVCPLNIPWIQDPSVEPSQLITFPQVSGFRLNQGLTGQLYAGNLANLQNYPADVADDLVNGEHATSSPFGPGVGTELFRAWVRGGAFSGLWCHDTNLTRLAGLDYEFRTLAQDDYDHRHGSVITTAKTRVFYPTDATANLLPRQMDVTAAIHGGSHAYLGASSARAAGTPRTALFHQHVNTDGSLVVESASGIHFVRSVSAVMPEESQAPVVDGITGSQPLDADALREQVAAAPRQTINTVQALSLPWLQHGIDVVTAILNKGRGGFDRLPTQWLNYANGVPTFFTSYDANMWRALPRTIAVTLDAVEAKKTVYVGRSSISLHEDGSIVFEDGWHSQIIMSGGNIMFVAAHDIITSAGRNALTLAGNTAGLRANDNIDLSANTGRVSIKAEKDLAMIGGNGGSGGVLIESKGVNEATKVGVGTAQAIGGIVLTSATGVFAAADTIGLNAIAAVVVESSERVQLSAAEVVMKTPQVAIYDTVANALKGYYFTMSQALFPSGLILRGSFYGQDIFSSTQVICTGSVLATGGSLSANAAALNDTVKPILKAIASFETQFLVILATEDANLATVLGNRDPLNAKFVSTIGFTFPTSKQLGTDIPNAFVLPEVRWQTVARRGGHGMATPWIENTVTSVAGDATPTSAYPGYECWSGAAGYRLHNADLAFSLATGVALPPVEGPIPIIDFDYVPLDKHFTIGDD